MAELYKIQGVEIFAEGTWNGDKFDNEDLYKMVRAFEETNPGIRPFLKLGHDDDQKLLQKDGLPAAGWIEKIYVRGDKLLADLFDIPEKIYQLIESKAYRKVSSEIFYNLTVGDKKYQYLLGAVALLGADTPGVGNLSDILGYYTKFSKEPPKSYPDLKIEFTFNKNNHGKGISMTPEQIAKLELELQTAKDAAEAKDAEIKKFTTEQSQKDKELADLKSKYETETKEKAQLIADKQAAELKAFVTSLKSEKLCSPAMEPLISELLGPEKKEYSVKIDKEDKKLSKEQLLKEALKLFKSAAEVNFVESSLDGDAKKVEDKKANEEKIAKYMADNKASYKQAVVDLGLLNSKPVVKNDDDDGE